MKGPLVCISGGEYRMMPKTNMNQTGYYSGREYPTIKISISCAELGTRWALRARRSRIQHSSNNQTHVNKSIAASR